MAGLLDRRTFLQGSAALAAASVSARAAAQPPGGRQLTQFQIACMTLPYSRFPLRAGPDGHPGRPAIGTSPGARRHTRGGRQAVPVLAADAPPDRAKELATALPRPGPGAGDDVLAASIPRRRTAWRC